MQLVEVCLESAQTSEVTGLAFEETYPILMQPSYLQDISLMMRPAQGFEAQYQMMEQPFNGMSTSETFEDLTLTADIYVDARSKHISTLSHSDCPAQVPHKTCKYMGTGRNLH
jgi:hypothetical protein